MPNFIYVILNATEMARQNKHIFMQIMSVGNGHQITMTDSLSQATRFACCNEAENVLQIVKDAGYLNCHIVVDSYSSAANWQPMIVTHTKESQHGD